MDLDWRENLNIELEKGTSVLSISYRDTDPDLVLPVIKRISKDYQSYSGRDRQRGLTQGVNYLEKQVAALRGQSEASMRRAQAYALANGLGLQDGIPALASKATERASVKLAAKHANRVNSLRQRLSSAKNIGARNVFQAPQLPANAKLFDQLQTLEANLLQKQTLLKPNDDSIRRLKRRRQNLIKYINQQTVGLLEGELITAQSKLASLSRPRTVVLRHRELVRTALRDEKTLAELENQLQTLQLEKARLTDPWELITTPTLLDKPVGPSKKLIMGLGLMGGLIIGCGSALFRERISGLIYSEDELGKSLPGPLLGRLELQETENWQIACELLARGPLNQAQRIALIPVGQPDNNGLKYLTQVLNSTLANQNLLVSSDLVKTRSCNTQLLVIQKGRCSRIQLSQLQQALHYRDHPLQDGCFLRIARGTLEISSLYYICGCCKRPEFQY